MEVVKFDNDGFCVKIEEFKEYICNLVSKECVKVDEFRVGIENVELEDCEEVFV